MSNDFLTPHDYDQALFAQSACNLSGIVASLNQVMPKIWSEARRDGVGTDAVNKHPIARLYAEQIAHLSGAGMCTNDESYRLAYEVCTQRAKPQVDKACAPANPM